MTEFGPPSAWTLQLLIGRSLRRYADRTALRSGGETMTYGELDRATNALADALVERGVGPEERVAVAMTNRFEFTVAEVAVVKAGAAPVKLNHMFTPAEVAQRMELSGAVAAFCGPGFVDDVADARDDLDALRSVYAVVDEGDGPLPDGVEAMDDLVAGGEAAEPPEHEAAPDDVARVVFTGGTTGEPKPVVYTHRTISARNYATFVEADLSTDDTTLTTTVLARAGGAMLFSGLIAGAENVLHPGFDAGRVLRSIEEREVTWAFLVPTTIYRLLDHPDRSAFDTGSLRTVLYAGAPITRDRLREAIEAFGPVFVQAYGQVETPMFISTLGKREHARALEPDRKHRLESAGGPCLMADVRIVDVETDEPLPPSEAGEILARAPYSMAGYLDRPGQTDEVTADGYVRTGDVGRFDDDGYLYILDRKSNVVVSGGLNVYTTEVEDALADHPQVAEVAVIGVPHDDWGEAVVAVVVPRDPEGASAESIAEFAAANLADYKEPKEFVFRESMPLTAAGKIDKAALRAPYWEGEERGIH